MEIVQQFIVKAAYRISQKPITSLNLVLISVIVNMVTILSMLDMRDLRNDQHTVNSIGNAMIEIREKLYLRFLDNNVTGSFHVMSVIFISVVEIYFLYLISKKQISELGKSVLSYVYYFKATFSLSMIAILAYAISNNQQEILISIKILAALAIFVSTCTQYIFDYLNFTCLYLRTNYTQQNHDNIRPIVKIIIKIVLVYTILRYQISKPQIFVLAIILLGAHLVQLIKIAIMKMQKYNIIFQVLHYTGYILISCYFVVSLLKTFVDLVRENQQLVLLSFFSWSSLAFYNVMENLKNSLTIQPPHLIKDQSQAITYIQLLHKVYQNRNDPKDSILFLGLIKDHLSQCENTTCICKTKTKFSSVSLFKDEEFMIKFVENNVNILRKKFDSIPIALSTLAFYVQVMKKFPRFFYESDMYKNRNQKDKIGLKQRYCLFQIQKQAGRQLQVKNIGVSNQKSNQLCIEEIFIQHCYQKLQKVIVNLSNFFKYNSRNFCLLNLLQKQLADNSKIVAELEGFFDSKKDKQALSSQIVLLMIFFYRCVLNLTFKARALVSKLELIQSKLALKQIKQQSFDTSLYSEKGCVIQSVLQSKNAGIVSRVSANTPAIFGYPTIHSMIGIDVNKLLPRSVREEHLKMIKNWVDNGSFSKVNRLQEAFCCSYTENVFKILMRTQIAVINRQLIIFVGIIKMDDQNCMLVNKNRQIDSYGVDFQRILVNQCKLTPVQKIFPKWYAIQSHISRKQQSLRVQMIPRQNKIIGRPSLEVDASKQRVQQNLTYTVTLQAYIGSMGDEQYYVLRKLSHSKQAPKVSLLAGGEQFKKSFLQGSESQNEQDYHQKQRSKTNLGLGKADAKYMMQNCGSVSSVNSQSNYSILKILQAISQNSNAGQHIQYPRLVIVTIILVITFIIIVGAVSCQLFIYIRGVQSFNQVIFADSAVSDNMQLLEMMYNKIMMVYQICNRTFDLQRCTYLVDSMQRMEDILYQLMAVHIQYLIKNQTFFKHKYYQYQFHQINMTMNGTYFNISTFQFMEYYIRSSKKLIQEFEKTNRISDDQIYIVENLRDNWPQMKKINHKNIQFYQHIGISQLNQSMMYVMIAVVGGGCFMCIYVLTQYWLLKSKEKLLTKILLLFRLIPLKTSEDICVYYTQLGEVIKTKNIDMISKINVIQIHGLTSARVSNHMQYAQYRTKIYLAVIWSLFIFFMTLSTLKMTEYDKIWQSSLISIGNLMQSENYLLQNYFEIKAFYLYPSGTQTIQQFEKGILQKLKKDQSEFVKTALQTNTIFQDSNQRLSSQFSEILVRNICDLTQFLTTPKEHEYCHTKMSYKILQSGILASMAFFQRTVLEAFFDLRDQTLDREQYFSQQSFKNIDDYLIYMLRMFQMTQAKMVQGLAIFISDRLKILGALTAFQLIVLIGSLIWWFMNIREKRKQLAEMYGYILFFPVILIKQSKFVQQTLNNLI